MVEPKAASQKSLILYARPVFSNLLLLLEINFLCCLFVVSGAHLEKRGLQTALSLLQEEVARAEEHSEVREPPPPSLRRGLASLVGDSLKACSHDSPPTSVQSDLCVCTRPAAATQPLEEAPPEAAWRPAIVLCIHGAPFVQRDTRQEVGSLRNFSGGCFTPGDGYKMTFRNAAAEEKQLVYQFTVHDECLMF